MDSVLIDCHQVTAADMLNYIISMTTIFDRITTVSMLDI